MNSARAYSSLSETRVKSAISYGTGTLPQGSFDNYLNRPVEKSDSIRDPELSLADQIRSIRLSIIRRIYDFLRKVYGMDDSALANYEAAAMPHDGSVWTRVDTLSYYREEQEDTTFETTGTVRTSDGRTIDFGISLSMSRSFKCAFEEVAARQYLVTDPLVINLDGGITGVSDQKFYFDLDGDGTRENISFARQGSGFLALDLNEDGMINDGSELFGTKSGNGFADLSEYDSDGNSWIDEADPVFDRLKVWVKEEDGTDRLMSLKEADVGAIYLGYAATQFTLEHMARPEDTPIHNSTRAYSSHMDSISQASPIPDAFIRSHGIFLHESGKVGTVAQVDMVS